MLPPEWQIQEARLNCATDGKADVLVHNVKIGQLWSRMMNRYNVANGDPLQSLSALNRQFRVRS
jgi:hypothetical protein